MPFLQSSSEDDAADVQTFYTGDRFPVTPGPSLLASGWRGGLFVMYVAGPQDYVVEKSDGNNVAGFLLFQSEKYTALTPGSFSLGSTVVGSPENFLSHQFLSGKGGQNVATMITGGNRAMFKVYETVPLIDGERVAGTITYNLNDQLKVSENGLLCNDSDAELVLAGVTNPNVVGVASAVPNRGNKYRLGIDYKY